MVYFTKYGLENYKQLVAKVQKDYEDLYSQLQNAVENGGDAWHDNFSYEELQRQIGVTSNYLKSLRQALVKYKIVDETQKKKGDSVTIGSTVKILRGGKTEIWKIGGYGESNPKNGLISYNTPLGVVLMGKKVNDNITFMQNTVFTEVDKSPELSIIVLWAFIK